MALPRWAQILIGVAIVGVFLAIGAIIAVTAWVSQNLQVRTTTERDAGSEFERVRQQFAGKAPLLELKDGRPRLASPVPESGSPKRLDNLHILAWDPDEEKLVRVSLPFWLLRMKSDPIRIGEYASGWDDERITLRPEDVEKYGPGIIIDTGTASGERVLVWAQ